MTSLLKNTAVPGTKLRVLAVKDIQELLEIPYVPTDTKSVRKSCDEEPDLITGDLYDEFVPRLPDPPALLDCNFCKLKFMNRKTLSAHIEDTHSSQEKKRNCGICGEAFADMLQHFKEVHKAKRHYSCTICNASFADKADKVQHIREKHRVKHYSCKSCGKAFIKNEDLVHHIKESDCSDNQSTEYSPLSECLVVGVKKTDHVSQNLPDIKPKLETLDRQIGENLTNPLEVIKREIKCQKCGFFYRGQHACTFSEDPLTKIKRIQLKKVKKHLRSKRSNVVNYRKLAGNDDDEENVPVDVASLPTSVSLSKVNKDQAQKVTMINENISITQCTNALKLPQCMLCEIEFSTDSLLEDHLKSEHKVSDEKLSALVKWGLSVYPPRLQEIPVIKQQLFPCYQCQFVTKSKERVLAHFKYTHGLFTNNDDDQVQDMVEKCKGQAEVQVERLDLETMQENTVVQLNNHDLQILNGKSTQTSAEEQEEIRLEQEEAARKKALASKPIFPCHKCDYGSYYRVKVVDHMRRRHKLKSTMVRNRGIPDANDVPSNKELKKIELKKAKTKKTFEKSPLEKEIEIKKTLEKTMALLKKERGVTEVETEPETPLKETKTKIPAEKKTLKAKILLPKKTKDILTPEIPLEKSVKTPLKAAATEIKNPKQVQSMKVVYPFSCKSCNFESIEKEKLLAHFKNSHGTDVLANPAKKMKISIPCDLCSIEFISEDKLSAHMTNVHRICVEVKSAALSAAVENVHAFRCHVCSFEATDDMGLLTHMENHAKKEDLMHSCLLCERKFSNENVMSLHMNFKHGVPQSLQPAATPLACGICHQTFATDQVRQSHMWNVHNISQNPEQMATDTDLTFKISSVVGGGAM